MHTGGEKRSGKKDKTGKKMRKVSRKIKLKRCEDI
jgi:hypothetical protein